MVSREEASERADQDHGDDDDRVWMNQNKNQSRIYHDDSGCPYFPTDPTVEFTRQQAQNRGYGACKVCTLETADKSNTGNRPTDLIETVRQKLTGE